MNIEPNNPSEQALVLLLKSLKLSEDDHWDTFGTDWVVRTDELNSTTFFRIRKGEFDVAIVFGKDDRIDICPVVGKWDGPGSLEYMAGNSVANMPFGEEWVSEIEEALETAAIKRRSTFTVCKHCKDYLPPEHMDEGKVCQSCASRHYGVIY